MNISSIGHRCYSTVVENLCTLTPQQTIMRGIALAALTILGAVYAFYRCCFKKHTHAYTDLSDIKLNPSKIPQKTLIPTPHDENLGIKKELPPALSFSPKKTSIPNVQVSGDDSINDDLISDGSESQDDLEVNKKVSDSVKWDIPSDDLISAEELEIKKQKKLASLHSPKNKLTSASVSVFKAGVKSVEFRENAKAREVAIEQRSYHLLVNELEPIVEGIILSANSFNQIFFREELNEDLLSLQIAENQDDEAVSSNRKVIKWFPLLKEKKIDQIEQCKQFLKNKIFILANYVSYRKMSDFIAKGILELEKEIEKNHGEEFQEEKDKKNVMQALSCLRRFLQDEKRWNPSIPFANSESDPDFDHLFKDLSKNLKTLNPSVITMEDFLSETSIDYEKILNFARSNRINCYDLKELKHLMQAITDGKIDLSALNHEESKWAALYSKQYDSRYHYDDEYHDYGSYTPSTIVSFLTFTGFYDQDDEDFAETYVKELFEHVIQNFKELSYAPNEQLAEGEKVLQKERFLEDLKFILTQGPNQYASYQFCDQMLEYITRLNITPSIVELRNFLITNDLWYSHLSEEEVKDLEKNPLLKVFYNLCIGILSSEENPAYLNPQKKEFLSPGTEENYQGGADRSNRDLEDPTATRWPRLENDRKSNRVKTREQSLNNLIAIYSDSLSNRDLTHLILQEGEYSRIGSFLKRVLKNQNKWDPSPPTFVGIDNDNNSDNDSNNVREDFSYNSESEHSYFSDVDDEKILKSHPMKIEEILSETSINYDNIIRFLDPYDFKGLQLLVQGINSEKINVLMLELSIDHIDEELQIQAGYIKNFLILKGFLSSHSHKEAVKEYVDQLVYKIIHEFKTLAFSSSEEKEEQFMSNLKMFLAEGPINISEYLCNEIVKSKNSESLVVEKLKKHLISNGLWNPVIDERQIFHSIDPFDLAELKWLVQEINSGKINLETLLSVIKEENEQTEDVDFDSNDAFSMGLSSESIDYRSVESIENYLALAGFLDTKDPHREVLVKKYAEALFNRVILDFRAICCIPVGPHKGEENVLEKARFLENLKIILTASKTNISNSLCDQILSRSIKDEKSNEENESIEEVADQPTNPFNIRAMKELKEFLLANQLWNPSPLEDSEEKQPLFTPDWVAWDGKEVLKQKLPNMSEKNNAFVKSGFIDFPELFKFH